MNRLPSVGFARGIGLPCREDLKDPPTASVGFHRHTGLSQFPQPVRLFGDFPETSEIKPGADLVQMWLKRLSSCYLWARE